MQMPARQTRMVSPGFGRKRAAPDRAVLLRGLAQDLRRAHRAVVQVQKYVLRQMGICSHGLQSNSRTTKPRWLLEN